MPKFVWWTHLALIVAVTAMSGCGKGEKAAAPGNMSGNMNGTPAATAGKESPSPTPPGATTPAATANQDAGKGAPVAAAAPTPMPTSPMPAAPMPAAPTPAVAPAPAPAVAAGPAPVPVKIDPAVQKRIAAFGDKLKEQSGKVGAGVAERNDLKQIGLAMHNYHEVNQHFPAANGSGTKDQPHPGLSWRVYLLPYIEQAALFEQFKLDEAWDSEHNKALIAKMPPVFGKNQEGKTQVHVLVGEGTAFKDNVGSRISDFTDGTSNSFLAVQGGADTADIWTKPGGLAFDPKEPLKCLGMIGNNFLVLMADGSVRKLAQTVDPKNFGLLAQISDGQVVGDFDAPAPGAPKAEAPKIHDPVTPLQPASPRLDLTYIPTDAFAAIVVHPRRMFEHPVVKNIRNVLPAGVANPEALGMPLGGPMDLNRINEMGTMFGIAPQNIDEVVILLDKDIIQAAMTGANSGVPPFGAIVRNSAPIEIEKVVAALIEKSESTAIQEHEGVSLIVSVRENAAFAFISDSMFLMGQLDFVKKMISSQNQVAAASGLTKRLDVSGNRLAVLAVDAAAIKTTVKELTKQLPAEASLFSGYILGAKELALSVDLDAPELLQVQLQFATPQLAGGLFGMLEGFYKQGLEQAPMVREMINSDPASKNFAPYFEQLVSDTKFTNTSDTIALTVPKLKDLEKLPELLKPAIEAAGKAAEKTAHVNNLKMIGLAFHNYHDTFNHFPALNGIGEKGQPHPGLSWRVYLLPYIDEAPLYSQFKLDEPWDSEHNKALIAKMPKIYGTNKDGKSSIHVLTGKGAPFQKDVGIGIRNITDGTSNTIMALEAGEDVADIWTKPGGLEFDPENPLKCLGQIKEFHAILMDGSVRLLKDLEASVFGRLVQYEDGMPVNF